MKSENGIIIFAYSAEMTPQSFYNLVQLMLSKPNQTETRPNQTKHKTIK